MKNRLHLATVNRAIALVQNHWQQVRAAARKAFASHGRGAFLIDLLSYQDLFAVTPAEWTYLDLASANGVSEGLSRLLLSSELEEYEPQRQIVFVFWNPESEDASIRVLTETPDGNPRKGPDRRWINATRTCPKCSVEFFSEGPWGQCPQCGHEFVADYSNQKTELNQVPPIVEIR